MAKEPDDRAQSQRGPRGVQGRRGKPGITPAKIETIIENIEAMQKNAAIQFERIAQLQAQLDLTLKHLQEMGNKAGRQRKRR